MSIPVRISPMIKKECQAFEEYEAAQRKEAEEKLRAIRDKMNAPRDFLLDVGVDALTAVATMGAHPVSQAIAPAAISPVTEVLKEKIREAFDAHASLPELPSDHSK